MTLTVDHAAWVSLTLFGVVLGYVIGRIHQSHRVRRELVEIRRRVEAIEREVCE